MRSTQIRAYAADHPDLPAPTAQQMFLWTRQGLLTAEMRGDRGGRYRWWAPAEVEVAFLVARLVRVGFRQDLAFRLARADVVDEGRGWDHRGVEVEGADVAVWTRALPDFPKEAEA